MTEPEGRVTPITNLELWNALYNEWIAQGRPGWVVRHAGGQQWQVIQHTSGSPAFDPQSQRGLYETTSF